MRCLIRVATAFSLGSIVFAGSFLWGQSKSDSSRPRAIEVRMIESEGITLPAEFQVALYENLVRELQKKSGFVRVYRDGDRNAAGNEDLVIMQSTVKDFRQGSERAPEVTTVAGVTSITIRCLFTNAKGESLLERDVKAKVRFFGGNLKATNDFAKKAANVAQELSKVRSASRGTQSASRFGPNSSQDSSTLFFAYGPDDSVEESQSVV